MPVTDWPGSFFPFLRSTKERFKEKIQAAGTVAKLFNYFQ